MTMPPCCSDMMLEWMAAAQILVSSVYLNAEKMSLSFSGIAGPIRGILFAVFFKHSPGHLIFIAVILKSPGFVLTNPSPCGPQTSLPLNKHAAASEPNDSPGLPLVSSGSSVSIKSPAVFYSVFSLNEPS